MREFKVGDKIRLTDKSHDKKGRWGDRTGTIVDINPFSDCPFIANSDDDACNGYVFAADELELVVEEKPEPKRAFQVGDIVRWKLDNWNEYWRGGKAEVVDTSVTINGKPSVRVKVFESIPANPTNTEIGDEIIEYPTSLELLEPQESVEHPAHYGGDTTYEVIKVIEAWDLDFKLGNSVKYIARAGKKDPEKEIEDLEKGVFYIQRRISQLKEARGV